MEKTHNNDIFGPRLSPFLKWPGGKTGELDKIAKASPTGDIRRFLDPFVGGGSVFLSIDSAIVAEVNDICPELIHLYEGGSTQNKELKTHLNQIAKAWSDLNVLEAELRDLVNQYMRGSKSMDSVVKILQNLTSPFMATFGPIFEASYLERISKDLPTKINRIVKLERVHGRELSLEEYLANVEGSIRSTFYMTIRSRYNKARIANLVNSIRDADFFFLREYGYASMFRFNAKGEFNIPYGGISYNRKSFQVKVDYLFSLQLEDRLRNAKFHNYDFENFISATQPSKEDFIFIDPPYDSEFSDYDGRNFDSTDQHRLANVLKDLDSKIMVVIGDTPLIRAVYSESDWNIQSDAMHYKWTIKSRNDRKTNHLTITNY